jgi:uncharacterized protein
VSAAPLLWLVAAALIAVGIAGLVVPVLPGAPLLFAGLWVAAWIEDFRFVGFWTLTLLATLALLTYAVDWWATLIGARRFGASKRAVLGAIAGSLLGIFIGLPGVLFGPFIGAVAGELSARRGVHAAARAGIGATIGLVIGAAVKVALAFAMIGVFLAARFF